MLESLLNASTKAMKYILFLSNFVFVVSRFNCILLRNLLSCCAIISVRSWNRDLDRLSLLWSWGKLQPHLEVTKNIQTKIFMGLYRLSGLVYSDMLPKLNEAFVLQTFPTYDVGYWYPIIGLNVTLVVSF